MTILFTLWGLCAVWIIAGLCMAAKDPDDPNE